MADRYSVHSPHCSLETLDLLSAGTLSRKRISRSILINNMKRKQKIRNDYEPPHDRMAKKKAERFRGAVREMGLAELPKLEYFEGMIRDSSRGRATHNRMRTMEPIKDLDFRVSLDRRNSGVGEKLGRLQDLINNYGKGAATCGRRRRHREL